MTAHKRKRAGQHARESAAGRCACARGQRGCEAPHATDQINIASEFGVFSLHKRQMGVGP